MLTTPYMFRSWRWWCFFMAVKNPRCCRHESRPSSVILVLRLCAFWHRRLMDRTLYRALAAEGAADDSCRATAGTLSALATGRVVWLFVIFGFSMAFVCYRGRAIDHCSATQPLPRYAQPVYFDEFYAISAPEAAKLADAFDRRIIFGGAVFPPDASTCLARCGSSQAQGYAFACAVAIVPYFVLVK